MSQTITQLQRGGNTSIDITSDGYTDHISLTTGYSTFTITFEFTGADADPILSFEGSNNATSWTNMYSKVISETSGEVEGVRVLMTKAFSDTSDGINSVSGDNIPFRYFRVKIESNGGTAGTMKATLLTEVEQ